MIIIINAHHSYHYYYYHYQYSFEEIERRLTRSGSGSGSGSSTSGSGGGNGEESLLVKLWSEPQESLFSSSLHNILLQYQQLQQQQVRVLLY